MSQCRSCRAEILWAATEHGKRIPLDADPYLGDDPRGLFVFRRDDRDRIVVMAVTPGAFPDEPYYRTHFTTCPNAASHRRRVSA